MALHAGTASGAPTQGQVWLAAGVAIGAGIIATVLFFQATGMVRRNPTALAAAEAMQAAELLFATVIGVWWLGESLAAGSCVVRRRAGDRRYRRVQRRRGARRSRTTIAAAAHCAAIAAADAPAVGVTCGGSGNAG